MRQVILTVLFTGAALAAEYGSHRGSGQIEGGGGVWYNGDFAKPVAIAGYRAGLGRFVSLYADYAYIPLMSETAAPFTVSASLMDYGGGAQFHLPVGRVEPYGLIGIGATRAGGKVSFNGTSEQNGNHHFNYAGGGGMRVYLLRYLGASVEYRAVKANDFSLTHRATLGLFFHLARPR